jgi:hypothetical protein
MESGEVFQQRVGDFNRSQVNRFDVLMTLVTEINPINILSLCIKILKRFLLLIVAERADHPIRSPLISAIGAEEKSFSNLFF